MSRGKALHEFNDPDSAAQTIGVVLDSFTHTHPSEMSHKGASGAVFAYLVMVEKTT